MIKIIGSRSYIDVKIGDKSVRIYGERFINGFIARKDSIKTWSNPKNVLITKEEKDEIIRKVTEETANSRMFIIFK